VINLGIPFLVYGLAAPMWFSSIIRVPLDLANPTGTQGYFSRNPDAQTPPGVDLHFFYDVHNFERRFIGNVASARK
jgi:hypothetical protein